MKKNIILIGNMVLFSAIAFSQQIIPVQADNNNKTTMRVKMPLQSQISAGTTPATQKLPVGMKARQATPSELNNVTDPSLNKNVSLQVRSATVQEKQ